MLIEYTDGKKGIFEYLQFGRKQGREFTRSEMDTRVTLLGDLNISDRILKNTKFGYKHITLSFKEDFVSREDCQKLVDEYMKFLMHGYKKEEYSAYAEIHYPKLKSYTKDGELVIRKPHIHLIISKTNLLTGELLRPLGYVKHNIDFTDAFQEKFNIENGFASPKNNRQNRVDNNKRFDIFERNTEIKQDIVDLIVEKDINSFATFENELKEFGIVKKSNKGKSNEYLSVKEPHHERSTRLKEFVFSKEFIENYSKSQKIEFLKEREIEEFIKKEPARKLAAENKYNKDLKYWFDVRALEVKYINQSSKFYKNEYKGYTKEQRMDHLEKFQTAYYQKNEMDFTEFQNQKQEFDFKPEFVPVSVEAENVVTQKLADIENEKFYKSKQFIMDMAKVYRVLKSTEGVLESKYQLVNGKIVAGGNQLETKTFLRDHMHFTKADISTLEMRIQKLEINLKDDKNENTYTKHQRQRALQESINRGFARGFTATNRNDMRILSEVALVHDRELVEMLLPTDALSKLDRQSRSDYQMRRANIGDYGSSSVIREKELKLKKGTLIMKIDKIEIDRIFAQEQIANRGSDKTSEAFLNIAMVKYNGVSLGSLEVWKESQIEKNKNVDVEIYDKFIQKAIKNAERLKDAHLLQELTPGNFIFTSEAAKEQVFSNYENTSKIVDNQQQNSQAQTERNDIKVAAVAPINIKAKEAFNMVAVNVNIASIGDKVDYYQIGSQDVAGRFSGIIHDKASEHDTARAYVVNDKVVSMEEFKKSNFDLFKTIEHKQNELFTVKRIERFNSVLRTDTICENVSLTRTGTVYANSRFNLNNDLKPIEMGITKFDKKLDKNFFILARDFITAKEFRDNLKVKLNELKEAIKTYISSKPELAASNLIMAAELRELKQELESVKTYQAAQELVQKHKREDKAQAQEQIQEAQEKKEEEPKLTLGGIISKARGAYDRFESAQDTVELAKDLDEIRAKIEPSQIEDLSDIVELFQNEKEGNIGKEIVSELIKNEDLADISTANIMSDYGMGITMDGIQKMTGIIKDTFQMAQTKELDFNKLLNQVVDSLAKKEKGIIQGQER